MWLLCGGSLSQWIMLGEFSPPLPFIYGWLQCCLSACLVLTGVCMGLAVVVSSVVSSEIIMSALLEATLWCYILLPIVEGVAQGPICLTLWPWEVTDCYSPTSLSATNILFMLTSRSWQLEVTCKWRQVLPSASVRHATLTCVSWASISI